MDARTQLKGVGKLGWFISDINHNRGICNDTTSEWTFCEPVHAVFARRRNTRGRDDRSEEAVSSVHQHAAHSIKNAQEADCSVLCEYSG